LLLESSWSNAMIRYSGMVAIMGRSGPPADPADQIRTIGLQSISKRDRHCESRLNRLFMG
jgi:hypothetical protein